MRPPALVPDWEEEIWEPVRKAWDARNLEFPPSAGQRSLLWKVVREFGSRVGDWVGEAPHETSSTFEIVEYVLLRAEWEHKREALFDELMEEERQTWLDLERTAPEYFTTGNQMRRARLEGFGLPEATGGENPYRVMLRTKRELIEQQVAVVEAARSAEEARKIAEAKRPHLVRLLAEARDEGLGLIDTEAAWPTVLAWGERTRRLIEAALGSSEAQEFVDLRSFTPPPVKTGYPFGPTVNMCCLRLEGFIRRVSTMYGGRLGIEDGFNPDEWSSPEGA